MTFAHWKNGSRFKGCLNQDPEAHRASEAAYKAGLRAGRKDAQIEDQRKDRAEKQHEWLDMVTGPDPAAICRDIAQRHESDPHEFMGSRYKAMGARECEEAVK